MGIVEIVVESLLSAELSNNQMHAANFIKIQNSYIIMTLTI